jgi:hypothetical protein
VHAMLWSEGGAHDVGNGNDDNPVEAWEKLRFNAIFARILSWKSWNSSEKHFFYVIEIFCEGRRPKRS